MSSVSSLGERDLPSNRNRVSLRYRASIKQFFADAFEWPSFPAAIRVVPQSLSLSLSETKIFFCTSVCFFHRTESISNVQE